ncbi:MAG: ABC transporter ATP-binding protein [Sulfurifustaceae bacterium]
MAQVELNAVCKRYGDVAVVADVSFTVPKGTLTTLLGPSGCGKTTMLRLIAGLELPERGRIVIGGADVSRTPAADRGAAMVFQSYALFPHMTVLDNVAYGLLVHGKPRCYAHERARTVLRAVQLEAHAERLPSQLSGGQQQRVAIARALVLEPDVLLFDEPLSNLDARLRRAMRAEIRELQRRFGLTVVYVTHDQSEAMAISDQIVVLNGGRVAQAGSPHELYHAPVDEFVAAFMGDCNVVDGELLGDADTASRLRLGDVELDVSGRGFTTGAVRVAIRPEGVRLAPSDGRGMCATVRSTTCLGSVTEIRLDTAFGEWLALAMGSTASCRAGDRVKLDFDAACVMPLGHGSGVSVAGVAEEGGNARRAESESKHANSNDNAHCDSAVGRIARARR